MVQRAAGPRLHSANSTHLQYVTELISAILRLVYTADVTAVPGRHGVSQ